MGAAATESPCSFLEGWAAEWCTECHRPYSTSKYFSILLVYQVEKNLAARLQAGVQAWTDALEGKKKDIDLSMDTDAPAQPTHKPGGEPQVNSKHLFSFGFKNILVPNFILFGRF